MKTFFSALLCLCLHLPCSSASPPVRRLSEVIKLGLPVVVISTVDNEEPTCDYVQPPEGSLGESIANAKKVPGRVMLILGSDTLYDSVEYEKGESGMTINIRGNSSAYSIKSPFKIKLQEKADLLFRGDDDHHADSDWALIYDDPASLRPLIGSLVAKWCGVRWQPEGEFVNVWMNNEYRGIYYLTETVKRNPLSRINVKKNKGFIVEYDPYWWNEDLYFETRFTQGSPFVRYTFKYPDGNEVSSSLLTYATTSLDRMEASIIDGTYPEYIDVESFATWLLVHDILGTWDSNGSNIFLYKTDNTPGSKVCFGPLWDFDTIFQMEDEWSRLHDHQLFPGTLFPDSCGIFTELYYSKLDSVCEWLPDTIDHWIDAFSLSPTSEGIERSRPYDNWRWETKYVSVSDNLSAIRQWFHNRREWLLGERASISSPMASHVAVHAGARPSHSALYDLSGRILTSPRNGQVVVNGGRKQIHHTHP